MYRLAYFIIFSMAILLTSCTSYQTMLQRSQDYKACQVNCQQELRHCRQVCHDNCPRCSDIERLSVAKRYARYEHEQCVQGEFVRRQLQSYRDPLQCRKMTCDCRADYRVCAQSCAGTIRKNLQIDRSCC